MTNEEINKEELIHLNNTLSHGPYRNGKDEIWMKAFRVFNLDPKNKKMGMGCGGCYSKVYQYHLSKSNGGEIKHVPPYKTPNRIW